MNYAKIFTGLRKLEGEKTVLWPAAMDMLDGLQEAIEESRAELSPFMSWASQDVEGTKEFLAGAVNARLQGAGIQFGLKTTGDDRLLGMMGLFKLHQHTPRGEIGYWTRTSATGRGYTTDALKTLLAFCRGSLALVRVDAAVATNNIASQRVLEKCGFVEEGLKANAQLCRGRWLNHRLYGIVFEENLALHESISEEASDGQ